MSRVAVRACALGLLMAIGPEALAERAPPMVWIEASAIRHSHYQPWSSTVRTVHKNGVVVEEGKVLTTAAGVENATLLRVRAEGDGRWRLASVDWIDPHANLALLDAADDGIRLAVRTPPFARRAPDSGPVRIWHFLDGRAVSAPGTVRRVHVPRVPGRVVAHLMLEVIAEFDDGLSDPVAGVAENAAVSQIVAAGSEVIGLGAGHDGKLLRVIPAPFIAGVLERKERDPEAALAWYPFSWQNAQSPAIAAFLGLPGRPRGVVVSDVPVLSPFSGQLLPRDLILSIDGFEIESDGNYLDPVYGYLSLDNLSTRGKFAGDLATFEIWREGRPVSIELPLPRARYADALVPDRDFGRSPQYSVVGGLVFQPFTADYLRSWGAEWRKSSPFRLRHYLREPPLPERRHLVVLSQVLPDPFNTGYRDFAFRIVDRVNGQPIADLRELEAALQSPQDGFHVVDLLPERGPSRIVLDSAGLAEATRRVVGKYGLPAARVIH